MYPGSIFRHVHLEKKGIVSVAAFIIFGGDRSQSLYFRHALPRCHVWHSDHLKLMAQTPPPVPRQGCCDAGARQTSVSKAWLDLL